MPGAHARGGLLLASARSAHRRPSLSRRPPPFGRLSHRADRGGRRAGRGGHRRRVRRAERVGRAGTPPPPARPRTRLGQAEHRPAADRRPALGRAVAHAHGREPDRGQGRDVRERLRGRPALLPQPDDDPHRQVLALDEDLPEPAAQRRLPLLRARGGVDDRDVAPRRRLPHRADRQVPEPVHARGRRARAGRAGTTGRPRR